ncbi:NUDIX domain-containing protein, partial [Terfezia claveryi]
LLTHIPFLSWLNTLTHSLALQRTSKNHPFYADPYELKSIKVNHINYFGRGEKARIGFVSMDAEIKNSSGESLPGIVFLRGGAVAVLVVMEEDEGEEEGEGEGEGGREQWTIVTSQPRIPVGTLRFLEIPAGMIDSAGKVTGKAAEEIKEELGITIDAERLIDLCALTEQMGRGMEGQGNAETGMEEEKVEVGMYPSAGGSDEFIKLYAYVHRVGKGGVKELEGKVGGVREDGERIILRVVKLRDLWKVAGRDAKALGAWALWRGLKEAGVI